MEFDKILNNIATYYQFNYIVYRETYVYPRHNRKTY